MNGLEPLIPIALILAVAAVSLSKGPLGRALAERWAGRHEDESEREALRAEVDDLRARLGEVEERLDFAERLLARERREALPE